MVDNYRRNLHKQQIRVAAKPSEMTIMSKTEER
jgi:hypothetical protein